MAGQLDVSRRAAASGTVRVRYCLSQLQSTTRAQPGRSGLRCRYVQRLMVQNGVGKVSAMKWKYFTIPESDAAARTHILQNLATCAQEHTLSKKLLAHFAESRGPLLMIAFESIDLDYPYLYQYATYNGGKSDASTGEALSYFDSPIFGLIEFIQTWLGTSCDAAVLCENWLATREEATRGVADGSWESRPLCFGANQVYHVLTNDDCGNGDAIEATLRESQYYWAVGVCSRCADLPRGEIPSEAFFDEIVASTEHIFVPALDEEGFLVWSPRLSTPRGKGSPDGG